MKCEGFLELFTKSKSHQSPARQSTRQMPERKWENISNSSTNELPLHLFSQLPRIALKDVSAPIQTFSLSS